jgi:hypothetical protein
MIKMNELISKKYTVDKYDNNCLYESQSLSKVWSHSKKGFITMSAFRGNFDLKTNMTRHSKLKSDLKKFGLGFWEVDGVYEYDDGTVENELSVFVPFHSKKYSAQEFLDIAKKLGANWNQESILYYTPEEGAKLVYKNKEENIGSKIDYDTLQKIFTKLRKGSHAGRKFSYKFEGVRIPNNHISALGMKNEGIIF